MTKKIGDKKIGGVKSTSETSSVDQASSVSGTSQVTGVNSVKATSGVGSVKGTGAIGKRLPTRTMTAAERAQLFRMIDEESDKLISSGIIPASKRNEIQGAVRMVIDSGTLDEENETKKK